MKNDRPQCLKCRHYYATFDPSSPRGCKAYGFKSPSMPSSVVLKETGTPCQVFELGAAHQKKLNDKVDFNDPKYWGD